MLGGVGIDIVPVGRIASLIDTRGTRFLERWFTPAEIEYCSRKAVPSRHFAARFAAKEAVIKALPLTWKGPLPWRLIEVARGSDGAPSVRLSGAILEAAKRAGVAEFSMSLAHCDEYASAVACAIVTEHRLQRTEGEGAARGHGS